MDLRQRLEGALVMAPMTKGSNLPYRRLCVELGARVLMSEMTVARRLKQRRRGEYALIRRAPDEPFFGVQLAGTDPEEMGWAAALVESRGADLVDVNFGCPIDHFTRKGMGAALGRQPKRIRRIVEGMKRAVTSIPVTAKIRLGWNDVDRNYLEQAQAAVDGGADAIVVHGRTRDARYRQSADWDAIGEVVAAVPVPVVGNGDILFPHDIADARARSGCAGVMAGRGALIKPWMFREAAEGYLGHQRRTSAWRSTAATSTWPASTGAKTSTACRESGSSCVAPGVLVPLRAAARPTARCRAMQTRESTAFARSPLEALLARGDDAASTGSRTGCWPATPWIRPRPRRPPRPPERPATATRWLRGETRAVFGDHEEGASHTS